MKKIIIPVAAFFVIVLGIIIFYISSSYQLVQYGKDTRFHIATLSDGGTLTAELDGLKTQVIGRNVQRVGWVLDISEKSKVWKKPDYNENEAIYLTFSDGAEYVIAKDPEDSNAIFILYEYNSKKVRFHLEGYNAWSWATRATAPDGLYIENIVLN